MTWQSTEHGVLGGPRDQKAPRTDGLTTPALERRLGRADLSKVSDVRADLRRALRQWGSPERLAVAELLTSEVVTNALVHTDRGALLTAQLSDGRPACGRRRLRVEVRDFLPRRPAPPVPVSEDSVSGRGLLLVETLADGWGIRTDGWGKTVWFELRGAG